MTTSKDPSYPWYPRDALVDFERLSADGELIARRLLDFQWLDGHLDANPKSLAALSRKLTPARWRRAWLEVEGLFPVCEDDPTRRQNGRLERIRREREAYQERQSNRGKQGATVRWRKGEEVPAPLLEHSTSIAQAMPTDSSASASASAPASASALPTGGVNQIAYLTRCVVALNRGLAANPHLAGYREVATSEQQGRVTWEADGIPVDLAERVVEALATGFRPSPRSRQPNSLRYFDDAVRRAHETPSEAGIDNAVDAAIRRLEQRYAS